LYILSKNGHVSHTVSEANLVRDVYFKDEIGTYVMTCLEREEERMIRANLDDWTGRYFRSSALYTLVDNQPRTFTSPSWMRSASIVRV
jgi:hypothetical protein